MIRTADSVHMAVLSLDSATRQLRAALTLHDAGYKTWANGLHMAVTNLRFAVQDLGFDLIEIRPPVTSDPGRFDGRDGGRMHEHSTAQEA